MQYLWDSEELIEATGGRPVGQLPSGISGISIDTRTLAPGEAYFAIKGDRLDGHDFLTAAMKAGASMAVVAEEKLVALGGVGLPLVVVSDVLEALRLLAAAARERTRAQIIAVTGSVGKTTTKEMLRTVLGASGRVHASAASFNNHWGVPLTLARLPVDARFGVFEIGMNHPDEIRPLVKLVKPNVSMITNVAAAHLGAFDSIDGIAHAKAEIFEGLIVGGYGLINRDDKRFKLLSELATEAGVEHLYSFGSKRGSDFRRENVTLGPDGSDFEIVTDGQHYPVRINLPGAHLVENASAVFGACILAGADPKVMADAFQEVRAEKGRGESHKLKIGRGSFTLIDESYNANPASMGAALGTLNSAEKSGKGRRIAVLGDMRELGKSSAKLHRELAKPIKESGAEIVLTVGEEMEVLGPELPESVFEGHYADWKSVAGKLHKLLRQGDVIMVKASNGLRFANLVADLKDRFKPE